MRFAFESFCERLPQALLLLLFYSFHNDDDDDDDQLKKDTQNYDQKLNKATNTFKVYFIYKCVYVCVKCIRTIAYIFTSEEVCGLIRLLGDAVFFFFYIHAS